MPDTSNYKYSLLDSSNDIDIQFSDDGEKCDLTIKNVKVPYQRKIINLMKKYPRSNFSIDDFEDLLFRARIRDNIKNKYNIKNKTELPKGSIIKVSNWFDDNVYLVDSYDEFSKKYTLTSLSGSKFSSICVRLNLIEYCVLFTPKLKESISEYNITTPVSTKDIKINLPKLNLIKPMDLIVKPMDLITRPIDSIVTCYKPEHPVINPLLITDLTLNKPLKSFKLDFNNISNQQKNDLEEYINQDICLEYKEHKTEFPQPIYEETNPFSDYLSIETPTEYKEEKYFSDSSEDIYGAE